MTLFCQHLIAFKSAYFNTQILFSVSIQQSLKVFRKLPHKESPNIMKNNSVIKNLFAKKPCSGGPQVFSKNKRKEKKKSHSSYWFNSMLQKGNLQFQQKTIIGDMTQNPFQKSNSTPKHATGDIHIFTKTEQITEIQWWHIKNRGNWADTFI